MPTALTDFMAGVTGVFEAITKGITVFTTPPLSYFVYLAFAAAGVGIAKKLIPAKRSR